MIPHQEMQERGLLETYSPDKEGKILFISHQWLGFGHPDPEFEQSRQHLERGGGCWCSFSRNQDFL